MPISVTAGPWKSVATGSVITGETFPEYATTGTTLGRVRVTDVETARNIGQFRNSTLGKALSGAMKEKDSLLWSTESGDFLYYPAIAKALCDHLKIPARVINSKEFGFSTGDEFREAYGALVSKGCTDKTPVYAVDTPEGGIVILTTHRKVWASINSLGGGAVSPNITPFYLLPKEYAVLVRQGVISGFVPLPDGFASIPEHLVEAHKSASGITLEEYDASSKSGKIQFRDGVSLTPDATVGSSFYIVSVNRQAHGPSCLALWELLGGTREEFGRLIPGKTYMNKPHWPSFDTENEQVLQMRKIVAIANGSPWNRETGMVIIEGVEE